MSDSNKIVSAQSGTNLTPSNTHHVKQLLQQYAKNAPLTLTGPSAIEEQTRFNSKYAKFKLNNDVSLSKVYPVDNSDTSSSSRPNNGVNRDSNNASNSFESNGQVLEQVINKQMMIQRAMRQYQEQMQMQQSADRERERSRERQLSGRSRQNSGHSERHSNHLSGEQIRKLRENQKHQERLRAEEERRAREARLESSGNGKLESVIRGKSSAAAFKSPGDRGGQTGIPIMSSSDSSWSALEETHLDGEQISCFNVGGEARLCLPQILNSVLEKVSLQAINQACDELQIYCSTCSKDQLQVLKDAKILPMAAHQCGLITKSDAERLCSFLLDKNPPRASVFDPKSSPFSFKVQHDCFGRCEGLVLPEAYTSPAARCIECLQCEGLFSPQKFVCHAHDNVENRTCHWGFDSNNWRTYIKLSEDYAEEEIERHTKVMDDFKNRYNSFNSAKRRQDDDHYDKRDVPCLPKRAKTEDASVGPMPPNTPDPIAMAMYYSKLNAFRPWSPSKGGFPPLPGYPLHHPFRGSVAETSLEVRRSDDMGGHSGGDRYRHRSEIETSPHNKRKHSEKDDIAFPSLAEEISSVAEALTGAPVHAKETVLKILERLTQRLDRAERDRDVAIGRYRELQARFEQLEEELSKKRGELRELLRQDSRAYHSRELSRLPSVKEIPVNGRYNSNGKVESAENLNKTPLPVIFDRSSPSTDTDTGTKPENERSESLIKAVIHRQIESEASEQKESTETTEVSEPVPAAATDDKVSNDEDKTPQTELKLNNKQDSDNLQERMIKMEAELTALREVLSTRSKNNSNHSEDIEEQSQISKVSNGNDDVEPENLKKENADAIAINDVKDEDGK